jgi:hypothetical protein
VPAFETFGDDLYTGEIRTGDVPIIADPQVGKGGSRGR